MGTVPRAKGGLRSCAAAEERVPPHFVRPRPPPSRLQDLDLDVWDRDFLTAFAFCSSPAHLSFTPLW